MSKRTRWVIFYCALAMFLVVSSLMVVFALGYRYDFSEQKFVQMGSFRVITNTGASVYINGKLSGKTSFLNNDYAKTRLLPRNYTVRVEKEQHHVWQKNISIVAGLFSDFPKVVLVPTLLESELVATASFGFPTEESNIRITKGKSLAFDKLTISVEWLDGTDYQPFHQVGDFETAISFPTVIDDVQWYRDNEHVLIASAGSLWFAEIDTRGGANTWKLMDLEGQFLYDEDDNVVYFIEDKELMRAKL